MNNAQKALEYIYYGLNMLKDLGYETTEVEDKILELIKEA